MLCDAVAVTENAMNVRQKGEMYFILYAPILLNVATQLYLVSYILSNYLQHLTTKVPPLHVPEADVGSAGKRECQLKATIPSKPRTDQPSDGTNKPHLSHAHHSA